MYFTEQKKFISLNKQQIFQVDTLVNNLIKEYPHKKALLRKVKNSIDRENVLNIIDLTFAFSNDREVETLLMTKLPKIMSLIPPEEEPEDDHTDLYSANVLKDKDQPDPTPKFPDPTYSNISKLEAQNDSGIYESGVKENILSNRTGTNDKVSESFDVNIKIDLGNGSVLKIDPKAESVEAVQNTADDFMMPTQDKMFDENEINLDRKDDVRQSKELNESILSSSKSKKKVTFEFGTSDAQSAGLPDPNPSLKEDTAESSQPQANSDPTYDKVKYSSFNSFNPQDPDNIKLGNTLQSVQSLEGGLDIREDLEEDLESPIKDKWNEDQNEHGDSMVLYESSVVESRMMPSQTMESTFQTTMVMDEDSEDALDNMPDMGQFNKYTLINPSLEWFKKYVFDTPIKFKYNMHGVPLYKLVYDYVLEYEKDFLSQTQQAFANLQENHKYNRLISYENIDNSETVKIKSNLKPVKYEEKSGGVKSVDKLEDYDLRDYANLYYLKYNYEVFKTYSFVVRDICSDFLEKLNILPMHDYFIDYQGLTPLETLERKLRLLHINYTEIHDYFVFKVVFKDLNILIESLDSLLKLVKEEDRIQLYSLQNFFHQEVNKYIELVLVVKFYNHSTFVTVRLSSKEFETITYTSDVIEYFTSTYDVFTNVAEVNTSNVQITMELESDIRLQLKDFIKIFKTFREHYFLNVDPRLQWTSDAGRLLVCENALYSKDTLSMFNVQNPMCLHALEFESLTYENIYQVDSYGTSFIGRQSINNLTFLVKNMDEITCFQDTNVLFQTKNVLKKLLEFIYYDSFPALKTKYYFIIRENTVYTFQILEYTQGSEQYLTWTVKLDSNFVDYTKADFSVDITYRYACLLLYIPWANKDKVPNLNECLVDLPKDKESIEYLVVLFKIKLDNFNNSSSYILTADTLDSEENPCIQGVILDYTTKEDHERYDVSINKEFQEDQKAFMCNEKRKKNLKMFFCTTNNLMFVSWQNDLNLNLAFYDTDNELLKFKQTIPLKSVELNIPVTSYTVKPSRNGKPLILVSYYNKLYIYDQLTLGNILEYPVELRSTSMSTILDIEFTDDYSEFVYLYRVYTRIVQQPELTAENLNALGGDQPRRKKSKKKLVKFWKYDYWVAKFKLKGGMHLAFDDDKTETQSVTETNY